MNRLLGITPSNRGMGLKNLSVDATELCFFSAMAG